MWDLTAGEPLTPCLQIDYALNRDATGSADLPREERPVEDLVTLAQLLSGSSVDRTGGFSPSDPNELIRAWKALRRKYPQTFGASAGQILAWHEQEARASEQAWNWWPALFEEEWRKNLFAVALERVREKFSLRQFQLFDLLVFREWPAADVAKSLGLSVANVYVTRHRISAAIKKEIRKLEQA